MIWWMILDQSICSMYVHPARKYWECSSRGLLCFQLSNGQILFGWCFCLRAPIVPFTVGAQHHSQEWHIPIGQPLSTLCCCMSYQCRGAVKHGNKVLHSITHLCTDIVHSNWLLRIAMLIQICIYTYIALHYITLHYITLHYTTLHYTTLHHTYIHLGNGGIWSLYGTLTNICIGSKFSSTFVQDRWPSNINVYNQECMYLWVCKYVYIYK